ncbi:MAG: hypothetical protein LBK95_12950, partial [Bifidobacteriaceae bacterium]|nr:hypothetical protein [Bifidobacteriaceae bacterium]
MIACLAALALAVSFGPASPAFGEEPSNEDGVVADSVEHDLSAFIQMVEAWTNANGPVTSASDSKWASLVDTLHGALDDLGAVPDPALIPLLDSGTIGSLSAHELSGALVRTGQYATVDITPAGSALGDPECLAAVEAAVGGDDDLLEIALGSYRSSKDARMTPGGKVALLDYVGERFVAGIETPHVVVLTTETINAPATEGVLYRTELEALMNNPAVETVNGVQVSQLADLEPGERARVVGVAAQIIISDYTFVVTSNGSTVVSAGANGGVVPASGQTLITGASIVGLPDDANLTRHFGQAGWDQLSLPEQYLMRVGFSAAQAGRAVKSAGSDAVRAAVFTNLFSHVPSSAPRAGTSAVPVVQSVKVGDSGAFRASAFAATVAQVPGSVPAGSDDLDDFVDTVGDAAGAIDDAAGQVGDVAKGVKDAADDLGDLADFLAGDDSPVGGFADAVGDVAGTVGDVTGKVGDGA